MILVRVATENLQMFDDCRLDFCVTGQRAARTEPQPFGCLLFRLAIVAYAVIDDDTRRFLSDDLPRTFGFTGAFPAQDGRKSILPLLPALAPGLCLKHC